MEVVLLMLLAVVGSSYLVRSLPFNLPLPLVQIGLGAIIAATTGHGMALDPELFFLLFLPPLLFLDGWRIPKEGLFRDHRVILSLALGLVVITVIGAGLLIHWMIPMMPLAVAFALAAIVSPTDPVALSSITARVPVPKRLMHILEGESLLNDATGLVCFRFAVAAALTGAFSLTSASLTFLWVALAGLAIGGGITLGIAFVQRQLLHRFGEMAGCSILVNVLVPFGAYLAAEHLGASGILAAVAAGITMSYVELSGRALGATRVQGAAVWDMLQFSLNGIVFVLLGEQLPGVLASSLETVQQSGHASAWWLLGYALAIYAGLLLLRLGWVWLSLLWGRWLRSERGPADRLPHWRLVLATSLAGVRGAITLAGVMTLPLTLADGSPFPARDLAITLAMAVILLSLLGASLGLPQLLRGLEIPPEPEVLDGEDLALREGALAALAAIQQCQHALSQRHAEEAEVHAAAAARAMQSYQQRLDERTECTEAAQLRRADHIERTLRLAGLRAERARVFELARQRRITEQAARRLARGLDLSEAHLAEAGDD